MSQSDKLRQQGNVHYRSVTPELSPVLQKSRLDEARKCYINALECSCNAKESASANKNLAMVSWKLASLGKDPRGKILYFFKEAQTYFSRALHCGKDAGNEHRWADELMQKMYQSLQESLDYVNNQAGMLDEKTELLSKSCRIFPAGELKAQICVGYVEQLLGKATSLLRKGTFKRAMSVLGDCYQPLEIARRYGINEDIMVEIDVFSADVTIQTAIAEAKQALKIGDDLKAQIIMLEEQLNMDMVFEVIDWYRKSIVLTRELDVETEAIATSRIADVYHRILKLKSKARPLLNKAVTLAHTVHPHNVTQDDWYKACAQTLSEYQINTKDEETAAWMKEREETVEKLKEKINKFKNIEDNYECMKYIYDNHPPKIKKHKLPKQDPSKMEQSQIKKLLQKAIVHYHPDRNSKEKHGIEWYVLCEEISKVFTDKYNRMKGVD
ncbi:uncharacterized protein [Antedon mediterranea]|uniref:uncharacterized protein n=1 Tax=Antedon mediterranea TaxID=105859 RepID=UPI003AF93D47